MTNNLADVHVGIIICTHNRASLLTQTLNTLLKNVNIPENFFSVHIVLNACCDDSETCVNNFKKETQLPVEILIELKPGKSQALNHALRKVKKDFYFFLDDDQLLEPDYLQQVYFILCENQNIDILTGFLMPAWDGSEPKWVHNPPPYQIPIRPFPEYDQGHCTRELTDNDKLPSGGNIIVNKKVIDKVGRFSTQLGPTGHNLAGGEDHDFIKRALDHGYRILYNPKLRQFHQLEHERMEFAYMMKKSYKRSFSMIKSRGEGKFQKFMIRKVLLYFLQTLFCFRYTVRFYYCIKLSAALGEMNATIFDRGSPNNE